VLVGQGQVLHHAQAAPPGGQHRPPQLLLGEALQDAHNVLTLPVQEGEQQRSLFVHA